ncbi:hypothetical protein Cgig2_030881 [Carnegiea gigantea]|uniref:cysteine dioxygenase n=1 Tax=Carnegiea gigantea TaxID=171969 RepID=A0A9Q1QHT9_9CARY|nr:hypothetical protein Cgig2_030881 [Carnegiea gigantea]
MKSSSSSSKLFAFRLVAAWYSSNIGVLLLNKYLLSNYGFKYLIFLTMCHMTACSLLSYIAIAWMKMVPMQTIRSRVQFFKISALSLIFCASVVSGNVSLKCLPVSFNQAISATTSFFTAGEPSFHLFGFIMCIGATAARALKSVVQGILLSSEGEKLNSMNLLLYMALIAVVFLLPATLWMKDNIVGITLALARDDVKIVWNLIFNSALAYFVSLTNFLVTKHTSALTFQMCMFCFRTSAITPLHHHPGMTVFSKLLYGFLHVKAYEWVEPTQIVRYIGPNHYQASEDGILKDGRQKDCACLLS